MKREIKFRGYSVSRKEWIYGSLLKNRTTTRIVQFTHVLCGYDGDELTDFYEVDESSVMQYTGLKDKNGKEIYEGDVLKVDNGCNTVISWDNDGCRFIDNRDFDSDSFTYYDGFSSMSEYEVIGNIYENPELL